MAHPIIQNRIEYFKAYASDDATEDLALLQTIRIPKNLLFLSDKLPQPNYEKQSLKNYHSFLNKNDLSEIPLSKIKKIGKDDSKPMAVIQEISPKILSNKGKNKSIEIIKREKSLKIRLNSGKRHGLIVEESQEHKRIELPQLNILSGRQL